MAVQTGFRIVNADGSSVFAARYGYTPITMDVGDTPSPAGGFCVGVDFRPWCGYAMWRSGATKTRCVIVSYDDGDILEIIGAGREGSSMVDPDTGLVVTDSLEMHRISTGSIGDEFDHWEIGFLGVRGGRSSDGTTHFVSDIFATHGL
jgi:hypothetical protein